MVCPSVHFLYYYVHLSSIIIITYIHYHIYIFFIWWIHCVTFSQVIQTTNIVEEWVDNAHAQLKKEEARRIAAIQTPVVAEKRIKDLNTKLTEANRERKSVEVALVGAEK